MGTTKGKDTVIPEEEYIADFFEDKQRSKVRSSLPGEPNLKNETSSVSEREAGNKLFRSGDFVKSLERYGISVLLAESPDSVSCGMANRSAALFHLALYQDSISDIEHALSAGYAEDRRHKLYLRRARCHAALGSVPAARQDLLRYTEAVRALRVSQANKDKLLKEAVAVEKEIEALTEEEIGRLQAERATFDKPRPAFGENKLLVGGSTCITLRQSERRGRHVVTTRAVAAGATLFVEEPYACVLLPDRRLDHCHHCIAQTYALVPCLRCSDPGYCSAACREAAAAGYHRLECGRAGFLDAFGIGRAAVRVITTAGLEHLTKLRGSLVRQPGDSADTGRVSADSQTLAGPMSRLSVGCDERAGKEGRNVAVTCDIDRCDCYTAQGDRYLAVFHLMTHLDQCAETDLYHFSRAAATLALFLADKTDFFSRLPDAADSLESSLRWIAALLLRHILQLVCNAHAQTQLLEAPVTPSQRSGVVSNLAEERIATAVYPSASYMNHACDPSIINSFWGRTLIVRAVKSLQQEEEVFHCYGAHYARMSVDERRSALQEQYHFWCDCRHCTEPQLKYYLEVLDSPRCKDCGGATVPAGSGSARRVCLLCQRSADYISQLTQLQLLDSQIEQDSSIVPESRAQRLEVLRTRMRSFAVDTHQSLAVIDDTLARLHMEAGRYDLATACVRRNVARTAARYGAHSVELGNQLLTLTDLLARAWCQQSAQPLQPLDIEEELRRAVDQAKQIFSIHYGQWSRAYRDLLRKETLVWG